MNSGLDPDASSARTPDRAPESEQGYVVFTVATRAGNGQLSYSAMRGRV
jgi:hypothetical protein